MRRSTFLLRELVGRDLRARYSGSYLGLAWSFLQPLWQLVLFTFLFSTVMKVSPVGERTDNFGVFLFCGLLPWLALHETLSRAATAITDNAPLIKKVNFPSETLVLSIALSALVHEGVAATVFVAILVILGDFDPNGFGWLLLAVPVQLAIAVGLGLLMAAVQVFVRDAVQLLTVVLGAWFYFTPIVYPLALVPEPYRFWLDLNPLTALVGLYRAAFLGGMTPAVVGSLAKIVPASAALLVLGVWAFRRLRPSFADAL